ncbi:DoxX family protein [Pseudonocardia abyssalis]|jgi:putative oxidoreductase|nr:DoxX family protein [Pseudonocardia abyssalis]
MTGVMDQVLRTGLHHRMPRPAAVVRVVAGILFVVFGVPKFTDHARWVADFGTYGLPESSLLVYGTGLVEVLGGLALVAGIGIRVVAAVLALVMAGAVVGGGIVGGNTASLTLAPTLLAASLFVLWSAGPAPEWRRDRR